jgi:hypothetical protein
MMGPARKRLEGRRGRREGDEVGLGGMLMAVVLQARAGFADSEVILQFGCFLLGCYLFPVKLVFALIRYLELKPTCVVMEAKRMHDGSSSADERYAPNLQAVLYYSDRQQRVAR